MTFTLTESELQNAFEAIEHHGYSGLIPLPPEWETVQQEWGRIKSTISALDLDEFSPSRPMTLFAPKSRATVRPVCLMHPIDLIIYSALTLIIKDDIEEERVSVRSGRVFSYRVDPTSPNRFYGSRPTFQDFKGECRRKASRANIQFIATADIADFFPRIYQHRLENAIEASAKSPRTREVARVLVRKFVGNLLERNSYGIPIGPYASRILGEAVLIDVDAALLTDGADYVRWADDYAIFCKTEVEAQRLLFGLAERLFNNHGLTLSAIKTKILSKHDFQTVVLRDPEREVDDDFRTLATIASRFDPYSEEEPELTESEVEGLEQINFRVLIEAAIADHTLVDYERLQVILRHPSVIERLSSEQRMDIAGVLLANMEHLYPITEAISLFFQTFSDDPSQIRRQIGRKLVKAIRSFRGQWPPDYHMAWVLSVFAASSNWGGATEILAVFQRHPSDVVRRFAALALYRNGSRSDAMVVKSEYLNSSPLTRLAILLASRKLGRDERQHWRRTLQLSGVLEQLL